jgi:hypothetical protein
MIQTDKFAKEHTVNGIYYEYGQGCHLSPTCYACPVDDCKKGNHGTRQDKWEGAIPKCLNPLNCLECTNHKCVTSY